MKFKVLFLLIMVGLTSLLSYGQRGVRIGYIDTEYILQNVPEYQEATSQLDKKVLQWKSEIEQKLSAIEQKKKELDNESVLLTKELYEERYEEISYEEAEILDYQQKRFGPNGDLFIQKRQLMQPVQDQIFSAVQEIASNKKFDFIFDKSADVVMLYSAEQYDVSDQVLRLITRTSKRKQASSKKEREELEEEEVVPEVNEEKDARLQALEDKKAAREKELADLRAEREKQLEERRKQQLADREARRKAAEERRNKASNRRNNKEEEPKEETKEEVPADTTAANASRSAVPKPPIPSKGKIKDSTVIKNTVKKDSTSAQKEQPKTAAQILEEKKQKKLKEREARIKALEDRKKEILERRKKAREEKEKQIKKNDSLAKAKKAEGSDN
ncbi:MAG: OmpH family outer membrane protein [Winogradskyella sp.]|nr:OmpH family outer membrane protein [Winogradskyella sp.]NNK40946.1 OmpH family outer membrane protein [Winogradskyella sp.]